MLGFDAVDIQLDEYTLCENCGDELGTGHDGGNGEHTATVEDYRSQPEYVTCTGDAAAAWKAGREVTRFKVTESTVWPIVVLTGDVVTFETVHGETGVAGQAGMATVEARWGAVAWVSEPLTVTRETALKQSMWRYGTEPCELLTCTCGGYCNSDDLAYDGITVEGTCGHCGETVEVYA